MLFLLFNYIGSRGETYIDFNFISFLLLLFEIYVWICGFLFCTPSKKPPKNPPEDSSEDKP